MNANRHFPRGGQAQPLHTPEISKSLSRKKGIVPICAQHPSGRSGGHRPQVGRGRSPFPGFTLVELLVVITIIGILIALLLPAVQAAREAARKLQCTNNLKQLALACLNHEEQHHIFPTGGWGFGFTGDPDCGFDASQPAGWTYAVLPFIEQQALHDLGQNGVAGSDASAEQKNGVMLREQTPLAALICPTRRSPAVYPRPNSVEFLRYDNGPGTGELTKAAACDYAANAGSAQVPGYGTAYNYGWASKTAAAASDFGGIGYAYSQIRMADITDGTSNTYMLGEKHVMSDHYMTGLDGTDDHGVFEGHGPDTYRWCTNLPSNSCVLVPVMDYPNVEMSFQFGSAHPGSLNMAFCDGSVQSISYSIDPETHARLGNRKDGKAIDAKMF